jgi:hypothetical protein
MIKEEENIENREMEFEENENLNLEQMQKKFVKGVSSNKNKINMYEIK